MSHSAASPLGSVTGNSDPTPCSSSSFPLLLLPDEITLTILACVPRRCYPTISLVCKTLNRLISSPKIFIERSITHRTEHVLHVVLRSHPDETPLWFTLNRKPFKIGNGNENENSHSLVPIPSIPRYGMSIIATESEIYILGGCGVNEESVTTAFVIESGTNTCRFLPDMKEPRGCAAAGIIDGKLYVIGGCNPLSTNLIEAFDLKLQIWETVTIDNDDNNNVEMFKRTIRSFVMDDKIYVMDWKKSFIYDPKNRKLEMDYCVDRNWRSGFCVIDGRLYSFGDKNTIFVFDPISQGWSLVKGLNELPENGVEMANRGGRLVILYRVIRSSTEIWCVEIELERRERNEEEEGGEIWGKIMWSSTVLTLEDSYTIVRSLALRM